MGAGLRWRLSASLPTLSGGGSGAAGVWVLGKRRTGSEGNGLPGAPRRSDDVTKNFADVGQGVKKKKKKKREKELRRDYKREVLTENHGMFRRFSCQTN